MCADVQNSDGIGVLRAWLAAGWFLLEMGRRLNENLVKGLQMVANGMNEHEAWAACGPCGTWANFRRQANAAAAVAAAAAAASDEDASDEDAPPQTAQKRPAAAALARRVPTAASTDYGEYSVTVQSQPQSQEPWLVHVRTWRVLVYGL